MKNLSENHLWRNLCPGKRGNMGEIKIVRALGLVGSDGLGFCENIETSFPWYLFSSFLCVFSRSMLNVSLAKQADVSDNLNVTTKI